MIKLHNKDQQDAILFLIYFINHPLHVSNRWTIHYQEVALLYISMCYLSCIYFD